ncbi:MAG: septum formation initiator family protein [Robiginitomaculum sp.]|nr:septum formation initiator family protein [Robiginitomaculum sp.]MDQ7077072.1 septum formation initiator family protein [Robiginitomaculum sp.]
MSRFKKILPIAGFIWVIMYFAFHAFTGEQGMRNLLVYQQREKELSQQLAQLQACRKSYEKRIALLSDQNLDLDYLEERAHAVLALADPKDIVLTYKTEAQTKPLRSAPLPCS